MTALAHSSILFVANRAIDGIGTKAYGMRLACIEPQSAASTAMRHLAGTLTRARTQEVI